MKILVVAERKDNELRRVTLELAAKAGTLGETSVVEVTGLDRYSALPAVSALAAKAKSDAPVADAAPAKTEKSAKGRKGAKRAQPEASTTSDSAEEVIAAPAALSISI